MIDYFALALTHGLLGIAFWRLLQRDDLDSEDRTGPEQDGTAPPPIAAGSASQDRFMLPPKGAPRA